MRTNTDTTTPGQGNLVTTPEGIGRIEAIDEELAYVAPTQGVIRYGRWFPLKDLTPYIETATAGADTPSTATGYSPTSEHFGDRFKANR